MTVIMTTMLPPFLSGFALSAALIMAIGAQNLFVLRQGLRGEHVGPIVLFFGMSDAMLIAAGVGGVIKMIMAIRHGLLPKTLHVDEPTPHVDWQAGAVELLTENRPWPETGHPRRAGISSFGVSGTNAHLIIEQAPEAEGRDEAGADGERDGGTALVPCVLSARTPERLREQAEQLREFVSGDPERKPARVAWTLATERAQFEQRAVVLGSEAEDRFASRAPER